jgi:hypothetical protein
MVVPILYHQTEKLQAQTLERHGGGGLYTEGKLGYITVPSRLGVRLKKLSSDDVACMLFDLIG